MQIVPSESKSAAKIYRANSANPISAAMKAASAKTLIARAMGVAADSDADQLATARLVDELERLNADLDVPRPGAYGIAKERWDELLPVMSEQAIASGSPANNPMPADADAIVELYRQAWS